MESIAKYSDSRTKKRLSINPLLSDLAIPPDTFSTPRTLDILSDKISENIEEILSHPAESNRFSHILSDGSINNIRVLKQISTCSIYSNKHNSGDSSKENQRQSFNPGRRVSTFLNIKPDSESSSYVNSRPVGSDSVTSSSSTDYPGMTTRRPSMRSFRKTSVALQKLSEHGVSLNFNMLEIQEEGSPKVSKDNLNSLKSPSKNMHLQNDQGSVFVTALKSLENSDARREISPDSAISSSIPYRSETSDSVDYAPLFPSDVGSTECVFVFRIESMKPILLDPSEHGSFCIADCYIIMSSTLKDPQNPDSHLSHSFFTWIGLEAETDKRFCCAMYAVALRNLVHSDARIHRVAPGDESDEFCRLFLRSDGSKGLKLLDESYKTETGLYSALTKEYPIKLYRIDQKSQIFMFLVEKHPDTLNTNHVYLLDAGMEIYQWNGRNATIQNKSKARMIATRINKHERVGKAEVSEFDEGEEPADFWDTLELKNDDEEEALDEDFPVSSKLESLHLYRVFPKQAPDLEAHIIASEKLKKELLVSDGIYILDAGTELSLWIGKNAWNELRDAATNLLRAIAASKTRPSWISVNRYVEGAEPESFKLQFCDWQEKLPLPLPLSPKKAQSPNVDAVLHPYTLYPADAIDCEDTMELINSFLETFSSFVYYKGKFVALPEEERGHFFEQDAYVFLCVYRATEKHLNEFLDFPEADFDIPDLKTDSENDGMTYSCVIYFCQSRKTSKVPFSNFKLTTQKDMEELVKSMYKCPLQVKLVDYGMEPFAFLAHLENSYILHHGSRLDRLCETDNKDISSQKRLYQIRTDNRYQTTRTVQVDLEKSNLISKDCFFFMNESESETESHTLWRGDDYDRTLLEFAAEPVKKILKLFNQSSSRKTSFDDGRRKSTDNIGESQDINENFLPPAVRLIENRPKFHSLCRNDDFIPLITIPFESPKLFFCSCNQGYFKVKKYSHFIQKTLSAESCVILDPGSDYHLFVWFGSQCSETIRKLGRKSAMIWLNNCQDGRNLKPTTEVSNILDDGSSHSSIISFYSIRFVYQGSEPDDFKSFFIAWDSDMFKIEEPGNLYTRAQGKQGWQ